MTLPDHPLIREAVEAAAQRMDELAPHNGALFELLPHADFILNLVLDAALPKIEQFFREQIEMERAAVGESAAPLNAAEKEKLEFEARTGRSWNG